MNFVDFLFFELTSVDTNFLFLCSSRRSQCQPRVFRVCSAPLKQHSNKSRLVSQPLRTVPRYVVSTLSLLLASGSLH